MFASPRMTKLYCDLLAHQTGSHKKMTVHDIWQDFQISTRFLFRNGMKAVEEKLFQAMTLNLLGSISKYIQFICWLQK